MKALNRAIARTVSQLGRYGREGCHPPMLFALDKHLDALLALELKQAEAAGMKFATVSGDGAGHALPGLLMTGCASQDTATSFAASFIGRNAQAPTPPGDEQAASSIMTGGVPPRKGALNKLLCTPVEKWTSDQLAWFKRKVPLSNAECDELDARWNAARTQAEQPTAPDDEAASKLQAAADAATKAVREAVRYMNQRNRLRIVLLDALDSLEYVEKSMPGQAGFMVRQERIARAKKIITEIEGSHSSDSPVTWYQSAVQGVSDLSPQLAADGYVNATGGAMPAPDAIDMTDPRNWQVGDVVRRNGPYFQYFTHGEECTVTHSDSSYVSIVGSCGVSVCYNYGLGQPVTNFFTWLRHGEAQA